ncbi:fatty acid desaturase [Faunimonas sp. B44]|uniref:fatty acid desaturase n=1 Tax=Faunimonas sp. B44 TaxID=3461493 RepID=UPI004044C417
MPEVSPSSVDIADPAADARQLSRALLRYREPDTARSLLELAITAVPLLALWMLMWLGLQLGNYWLYGLAVLPAAGFLLRLFMIQHDCGHGAFFRSRRANDWVGRVIGVLTLTPYDYWRRTHAAHHASAGNLDRRGIGDIDTLTVCEYQALSPWLRLRYRLYRNPLVMFGIGPFWLFFMQYRLPVGLMRGGWQPWISTMVTNGAIALAAAGMIWVLGLSEFLLLYVPVALLASSMGVWLFYVQHQFEDTLWRRNADWDAQEAALHGSSYYDLPALLRWFTANIGVHHVHHLASRIPYYRLPEVMRDFPALQNISRLTLRESLESVGLVLWDEDRQRLISFAELPGALPQVASAGGQAR